MIDVTALHTELEAAGLPVMGVSGDGRIDYSRELTPAEQTTAQAIIAAHDSLKRERGAGGLAIRRRPPPLI